MSSETPCSSSSFSSKRKEISVYFDEGNQKISKFDNSSVGSTGVNISPTEIIDSDDEVLSNVRRKMFEKMSFQPESNDFPELEQDESQLLIQYAEKKSRSIDLQCDFQKCDESLENYDTRSSNEDEETNREEEDSEELKNERMFSGVWKYFKRYKSDDGEYTICQVDGCGKKYLHYSSTFNMKNHLLNKHKIQAQEEEHNKSSRSHILFLFLMFIITSGSPIRIVENEYLIKIFAALCPDFKVPCRKTIVKLLRICHETEKTKLEKSLEKASSIALTTDCWKSIQNFDYIGVTAHFLGPKFEKKNYTLATRHITGGKSAKNLAYFLESIMFEFKIFEKVKHIVTDNVITMKNAIVQQLKKERVSCFSHLLNLMIERQFKKLELNADFLSEDDQDETREINENEVDQKKISANVLNVIKKCKSIVGLFNHSPELKEKLYEIQKSKNQPNKMLINCVSTR